MLGDISVVDDIYIVCGYTDMRKQIDGLYSIVKDQFHMDPEQRALYLFCGRRCDRIKALLYENDGFVLLYKRLTASEEDTAGQEIKMKYSRSPGDSSTG
ncbi:MAG: IS66 family insertion sequence element accessory protein TnpB [Anaerostipes hadrus]